MKKFINMRKFIVILAITSNAIIYGQQTLSVNQILGDNSVFNGVTSNGKSLKYEDIKGTPYAENTFRLAKLAENYDETPVRYNSYRDEIEFKKGDEILVLPKQKEYSRISIKSPLETIVLLDTNDDLKGYFFELVSGKTTLYRKDKTIFRDAVPAANSYAASKPAEFKKQDPVYYIGIGNKFIKKPKNQKEIIDALPNLKEQVNKFVKENKIKFTKEEDLKKLVDFLNQN